MKDEASPMRSKAFQNMCRQRIESAATTAGGDDSPRDRLSTAFSSTRGSVDPDVSLCMREAPSVYSNVMVPVAEYSDSDDDPEDLVSPVHRASRRADGDDFEVGFEEQHADVVVDQTPPATPRMSPESPRTPRVMAPRTTTPPPLVPTWKLPKPPLLRALELKSVEQVHAVLQNSPDVVKEPFWEHDVEPPLCAAVRLRCSASILKLLLNSGANPEDRDRRGRTPYEMVELEQTATWEMAPPFPQFEATVMPQQFPQVLLGLGCGASFLAAQSAQMPWDSTAFQENLLNAKQAWRQEAMEVLSTYVR